MDSSDFSWRFLLLLTAFVLQVGFLVNAQFLSRARLFRLNELAEQGFFGARQAIRLVEAREFSVFAGYLAIVVLSCFSGAILLSFTLSPAVLGPRAVLGLALDPGTVRGVMFGLSAVAFGAVSVTAAALLRVLLRRDFERWIALQAPLLMVLLKPLCAVVAVSAVIGRVVRGASGLPSPGPAEEPAISAEELVELAEQSAEAGEIGVGEQQMIEGVLELSETVCREVMTPRGEVAAVPFSAGLPEVKCIFEESGCSRLIVYGRDLDDIVGVLIFKDLLPFLGETARTFAMKDFVRPPFVVQETAPVGGVLKQIRRTGNHLAVVVGEHGGFSGVVTIEDLIEEIVGDIADEFDREELIERLSAAQSNELVVEGGTLVADLNETRGLELPDGEYDTVAGLMLHQLARVPRAGDSVIVNGVSLTVAEMDQNRVARVRVLVSNHGSSTDGV